MSFLQLPVEKEEYTTGLIKQSQRNVEDIVRTYLQVVYRIPRSASTVHTLQRMRLRFTVYVNYICTECQVPVPPASAIGVFLVRRTNIRSNRIQDAPGSIQAQSHEGRHPRRLPARRRDSRRLDCKRKRRMG